MPMDQGPLTFHKVPLGVMTARSLRSSNRNDDVLGGTFLFAGLSGSGDSPAAVTVVESFVCFALPRGSG